MNVLICDPISPKGIALFQQRTEFKVTVLDKRLPEVDLLPLVSGMFGWFDRLDSAVRKKANSHPECNPGALITSHEVLCGYHPTGCRFLPTAEPLTPT